MEILTSLDVFSIVGKQVHKETVFEKFDELIKSTAPKQPPDEKEHLEDLRTGLEEIQGSFKEQLAGFINADSQPLEGYMCQFCGEQLSVQVYCAKSERKDAIVCEKCDLILHLKDN